MNKENLEPIQSILTNMKDCPTSNNEAFLKYYRPFVQSIKNCLPQNEVETRCASKAQEQMFTHATQNVSRIAEYDKNYDSHALEIANQIWTLVVKNCPACANTDCKFRD